MSGTAEPQPAEPPQLTYTSAYYNGAQWSASGVTTTTTEQGPNIFVTAGDLLGSEISLNVNGEWRTFTITSLHTNNPTEATWQATEKVAAPEPPIPVHLPALPEEPT